MTRESAPPADLSWLRTASLFGSGRDALVGLLRWGVAGQGWRRVWLPSYNCPEVPEALLAAGLPGVELRPYADAALDSPPALDAVDARPGDVVVVVNQLGVRPRPGVAAVRARGAVVVEDHSHDLGSPWALGSQADYAFASLRKTLPIPDGGAVWSPLGLDLPPEPAAGEGRARRLAGVLGSRPPARTDQLRFLALARAAAGSETPVPGAPISPVSRAVLAGMPVAAWRERRRSNLEVLADAVARPDVRVLRAHDGGVAFALTLVFDDPAACAAAGRGLRDRAVVPSVLWPLDPARDWGAGPADADLSARILCIHGDQRFAADDMRRLAWLVREALEESAGS